MQGRQKVASFLLQHLFSSRNGGSKGSYSEQIRRFPLLSALHYLLVKVSVFRLLRRWYAEKRTEEDSLANFFCAINIFVVLPPCFVFMLLLLVFVMSTPFTTSAPSSSFDNRPCRETKGAILLLLPSLTSLRYLRQERWHSEETPCHSHLSSYYTLWWLGVRIFLKDPILCITTLSLYPRLSQ